MPITIGDAIKEQAPELFDEVQKGNVTLTLPHADTQFMSKLAEVAKEDGLNVEVKEPPFIAHPNGRLGPDDLPGEDEPEDEQQISCDTCGYKDTMVCQSCKDMSLYDPDGDATCGKCANLGTTTCDSCSDHDQFLEAEAKPMETVQQDLEGNTLPPVTSEVETQRYKTWRTGKYHIKVKLSELEKVLEKGQSAIFQFIYRKMKPEKGTNITPELIAKEAVILYDAIRWG